MSAQLAGPLHVRAPTGFDLDDRDDVAGRTRKYKIDIHRGHCILIDRGLPSVVERYGFAPGREPLVFRTSSYRRAARFALYSCHSTATLCARTLARRMCRTRGVCRTGDAVQSKMPSCHDHSADLRQASIRTPLCQSPWYLHRVQEPMNPADNDPDWTKNIWFLREHDDLFEQADFPRALRERAARSLSALYTPEVCRVL